MQRVRGAWEGSGGARAGRRLPGLALALATSLAAPRAGAERIAPPPIVHIIYASADGAAFDAEARAELIAVARRRALGPVETLDLPRPPRPAAPDLLAAGMAQVRDLDFEQAERTLREAAAEVERTGGDGLDALALSNLYLHLGVALERADWRDLPEAGPGPAPAEAWSAYLQAATLTPDRSLYHRDFSPLARHRFDSARAEVAGRPRGRVRVEGPADVLASLDGRPAAPLPVEVADLPHGRHFLRVSAPGRLPWSALLPLSARELPIAAPALAHARLPDALAAQHARRMAAAFALVVEMKAGLPARLEVRLIDAHTGEVAESFQLPARGDPGALDAAVMRAEERARRIELERRHETTPLLPGAAIAVAPAETRTPLRQGPDLRADPRGFAATHWPLITAIGVAVATAVILGVVVSLDEPRAMGLQ